MDADDEDGSGYVGGKSNFNFQFPATRKKKKTTTTMGGGSLERPPPGAILARFPPSYLARGHIPFSICPRCAVMHRATQRSKPLLLYVVVCCIVAPSGHTSLRVSCKHRQARQTECSIPLIIRVESSNQSAWLYPASNRGLSSKALDEIKLQNRG